MGRTFLSPLLNLMLSWNLVAAKDTESKQGRINIKNKVKAADKSVRPT